MRLWHAPVEEPIMILRSYTENACGNEEAFSCLLKGMGYHRCYIFVWFETKQAFFAVGEC
jgi:hypothetical protein